MCLWDHVKEVNHAGGALYLIMIGQQMKFFIKSGDCGLRSRECNGVKKECGQLVL
jgi:hypothetical protein